MKKTALFLIALSAILTASAQSASESYMKQIPALPKDSCNATRASVESFVTGVAELRDQLMSEIDGIKESMDSHMESNAPTSEENTMKQMSQMYGVSQGDLEKMKNSKNMSDAEKQALANKMMSQQTNMTMDEAKNLGKMSEAGKKAYMEAYAAEAMATSQSDPNQAAKGKYAENLYNNTVSQQAAFGKITEISTRIAALYSPIESDPERQKMLDRIDGWNRTLTSMMGIVSDSEARVMDSLGLRVENEKISYCNRYTLLYRAALRKHLQIVESSMADFKDFGEISAETTKAQTGIEMPAEVKDLVALEAIANYLGALKEVYKYKLHYSD